MPKIKAYKGNGAIIPVDTAKISTAFRCPWTGEVFGTKKGYVNHLRALRENRIHRTIRARKRDRIFQDLINQPSFEKIIEWIETHPEFLFDGIIQNGRDRWGERRSHLRDNFWVKITYLDVHWGDSVSNSHSCPRGGVTNWGRRDILNDGTPAPHGYPGWSGYIEFQLSHDLGFGSAIMEPIGIYTGTGGGTEKNRYGYDVKFFASDWPGLEKNNLMISILKEEKPAGCRYGEPRYFRH